MRISSLLLSFVAVGLASQIKAEEEGSHGGAQRKFLYSATPEGKTLPTGVARFRLPYQTANGSTTYDKDGKSTDLPLKYSASGGALVVEYGLTDHLSLQMKTDFVMNQKLEADKSGSAYKSAKSKAYTDTFKDLSTLTGVTVSDQSSLESALATAIIGGCVGSDATRKDACTAAYANGTIKSDSLTAGITAVFGAGSSSVSAKDYVGLAGIGTEKKVVAVVDSVVESKTGEGKGLGDTIFGVLYELYPSDPLFISLGAGLRVPTGNRDLGRGELDTSRSAYELGARFNIDYLPMEWFMASWQNQSEVGLAGTTKKRDGVEEKVERSGVRNVGFVYLKPALSVLTPSLDGIRTAVGFTYDYDSAEKTTIAGKTYTSEHSNMCWMTVGLGYSFFSWGLPLQFDVDYEKPYKGKNVALAVTKTTATLKAFAKF